MQKPSKPSTLDKMQATAARLGEAAKKALDKSLVARRDATAKVAAYGKAVKATLKEAKASGNRSGTAPAARKVATKKAAAKKVGAKKAATKKVTAKKVAGKKVATKKAARKQAA